MSIAAYVCIVWGSFTSRYTTSSYIFFKVLRAPTDGSNPCRSKNSLFEGDGLQPVH